MMPAIRLAAQVGMSPCAECASSAPVNTEARAVAMVCTAEILSLAGFSLVPALLPQFMTIWSRSNAQGGGSPASYPAATCSRCCRWLF